MQCQHIRPERPCSEPQNPRASKPQLLQLWGAGADKAEETEVKLDAKIACNQLPPPPFKNLVKGAHS